MSPTLSKRRPHKPERNVTVGCFKRPEAHQRASSGAGRCLSSSSHRMPQDSQLEKVSQRPLLRPTFCLFTCCPNPKLGLNLRLLLEPNSRTNPQTLTRTREKVSNFRSFFRTVLSVLILKFGIPNHTEIHLPLIWFRSLSPSHSAHT